MLNTKRRRVIQEDSSEDAHSDGEQVVMVATVIAGQAFAGRTAF
jgi:hypothetical protein